MDKSRFSAFNDLGTITQVQSVQIWNRENISYLPCGKYWLGVNIEISYREKRRHHKHCGRSLWNFVWIIGFCREINNCNIENWIFFLALIKCIKVHSNLIILSRYYGFHMWWESEKFTYVCIYWYNFTYIIIHQKS